MYLIRVLIGSLDYVCSLWLARKITGFTALNWKPDEVQGVLSSFKPFKSILQTNYNDGISLYVLSGPAVSSSKEFCRFHTSFPTESSLKHHSYENITNARNKLHSSGLHDLSFSSDIFCRDVSLNNIQNLTTKLFATNNNLDFL